MLVDFWAYDHDLTKKTHSFEFKLSIDTSHVFLISGGGVTVLNGYLYALGGHDAPACQDSSKQFSSVERYDPRTDQWTLVAPMNNCRDAVGLAALGDKLYSVGGYDGTKYLDAVEAYDPEKNEWESVAPLTHPRAGACVVAIKIT